TRSMGSDLSDHRTADQRQVAIEIEDLVAHEFIAKSQRTIHDAALIEDDAVLDGAASGQTCGTELLDIAHEAECPCRSDLPGEVVMFGIEVKRLLADRRLRKVDLVLQHQAIRRHHADALLAIDDFDWFSNAEHRP